MKRSLKSYAFHSWILACVATGCATGKAVDGDPIDQAILDHSSDFRDCYSSVAPAEPSGIVRVRFAIVSGGKVDSAYVHETTLNNPQIENCVVEEVKKIEFPKPPQNGRIEVIYPFKFNAAKTEKPAPTSSP